MPFIELRESESERSQHFQKLPKNKPKHSQNIGKLRKIQPRHQAAMITEEGQKVLVESINKIPEIVEGLEEKKDKSMQLICNKQLEYFHSRDAIINGTFEGLMKALEGLSVFFGQTARLRYD